MFPNAFLHDLPALFGALFFAILFIQSGLDKVFDRPGNIEWLTGHFAKTPLASMVPLMLTMITVLELAAGILAAAGIVYYFAASSLIVIFAAGVVSASALTSLFFGQRVAKDYAGAAVLVPYFILALIVIYFTRPQ